MNTEFVMPQRYEGVGCGLTVAVFGLNSDIQYDKIFIYIDGDEDAKQEVFVDANDDFQTTRVTFEDLKKNTFYNVIAKLIYGGNTITTSAKMVSSIAKIQPRLMMASPLNLENIEDKYLGGALFDSSGYVATMIEEG